MPILVTDLNWTPIFEWCVVKCGSKNGFQKDMCLKEIELRAQNMLPVLESVVNIIEGDMYDHLTSTKIFMIMNEIFI